MQHYLQTSNPNVNVGPWDKDTIDFLVINDYAEFYRDIVIDGAIVRYYRKKD